MIFDTLVTLFKGILMWIITSFPILDFDPIDMFGGALTHMGDLNYFLPIEELISVVVAVVLIFPAFMGTTLFLFVFAQIRGSSARG